MPERLPVSVLLLTRNESARLTSLLPVLDFASEVVVVDDHSTDATAELAARLGARVTVHALSGFGPQRAFALGLCTQPWVLWIDADERLDGVARDALVRTVGADPGALGARKAFTWERRTWFLGHRIRWCGWRGERVTRLFQRGAARFDDAPVHERVFVSGAVGALPGVIEHHSYDTWDDCRDKLVRYAHAGAEARRRAGRRASALDVALRPLARFLRMYVLQLGVLDGGPGLAVCGLAAANVFLREMELWAGTRSGR
jgi:glycosyltransferase involved in cell wall biosynthesis